MKRLTLLLLSLTMGLSHPSSLRAQAEAPVATTDTIARIAHPDNVVILEQDSITQVYIYGRPGDKNYRFDYRRGFSEEALSTVDEHFSKFDITLPFQKSAQDQWRSRLNLYFFKDIRLGIALPLAKSNGMTGKIGTNAGFDIVSIGWATKNRKNSFILGAGFDWTATFQGHGQMFYKNDGLLSTAPMPEGSRKRSSVVHDVSLTFPISYNRMAKKVRWGLTAQPEYHFNTMIQNRYRIGPSKMTDIYRGIQPQRFGMTFRLSISSKSDDGAGFYLQYNPFKRYDGAGQPSFKTLSFGIIF